MKQQIFTNYSQDLSHSRQLLNNKHIEIPMRTNGPFKIVASFTSFVKNRFLLFISVEKPQAFKIQLRGSRQDRRAYLSTPTNAGNLYHRWQVTIATVEASPATAYKPAWGFCSPQTCPPPCHELSRNSTLGSLDTAGSRICRLKFNCNK